MRYKRTVRQWTMGLLMLMAGATICPAQEGLSVAQVFENFGHRKGCKMVEMHDGRVRNYEFRVYKSLTYDNLGEEVEPFLQKDRKRAKKIREVMVDGRLTSGYYMMAPLTAGVNRYVLFCRKKNNSGAVIYIEGRLSPDDILKLCK